MNSHTINAEGLPAGIGKAYLNLFKSLILVYEGTLCLNSPDFSCRASAIHAGGLEYVDDNSTSAMHET